MTPTAILAPVFVQVALTFALLLWMGRERIALVRSGALHTRDVALGEPNWPPRVTQIQNAFANQFELPLLFYLLIALALFTGHANLTLVVLSWLFVVTRLLHALVHTTTNNVPRRFFVYTAGLGILMLMWLWFLAVVVFG